MKNKKLKHKNFQCITMNEYLHIVGEVARDLGIPIIVPNRGNYIINPELKTEIHKRYKITP